MNGWLKKICKKSICYRANFWYTYKKFQINQGYVHFKRFWGVDMQPEVSYRYQKNPLIREFLFPKVGYADSLHSSPAQMFQFWF